MTRCLLLLALALALVQSAPQDSTPSESDFEELPWWKTSIIYQVYPRSFKDSDGDGTGDLKGITSKVSYLKELGIGAVWLSPIYMSPMADFGYDISSFVDIDPVFGTMADFEELTQEIHDAGLKLIMDFVPNHSSDEHEWFQKSLRREDPYTDYYVWVDPIGTNATGDPIPPNNWLSVFGFSAWEWSDERQQFYLHQFLKKQPDLNFRNPAVLQEMENILKFWLTKGVDGFRVDAIKHMYEVEDYSMNEPVAAVTVTDDPKDYYYLDHPYTSNQPETIEAVKHWNELLAKYEDKALVIEQYDGSHAQTMKYYGTEEEPVSNFPFNFDFIVELTNRSDVTGTNLKRVIDLWLDAMPEGKWPNWVLGNHDRGRIGSRLGADLVDSLNMLVLLLKGTPTTYYGEEIGMEDTFVTFEQARDPYALNFGPDEYTKYGRDPNRSPMQWDGTKNAGFSSGPETWLPVNENYMTRNVEAQSQSPQSSLKVYQSLARLRHMPSFTHGTMSFPVVTQQLLTFERAVESEHTYLVIINTSPEPIEVNMSSLSDQEFPQEATVELRSSFDERSETEPGTIVDLNSLPLMGSEGIVMRLQ